MLPPLPLLSAFLLASLVLASTPGPGGFYIVTRSATQGRAAGLASVAGVALGNLGNAVGASLGLAALFAVASVAFAVVKYVGAVYLVWLGMQALRAPAAHGTRPLVVAGSLRRVFADGFVVALLNPKTALFFAAFLPQFLPDPHAPVAQAILLGALFVLIAAITDSLYALGAGALRPLLGGGPRVARGGRYASASAFIGLGLLTAVSGERVRN